MAKPSYLSPIEAPKPAEIASLPDDGELLFLDIHSVNALRSAQHSIHGEAIDHINETHGSTLSYDEIRTEADKDCLDAYDEISRDFLKQFLAEDAPKFDEYLAVVRDFAIDKISEEEMALGKINPTTGERDEDTAGYKLLASIREAKITELGDLEIDTLQAEKDATAAEKLANYTAAEATLKTARETLAKAEVEYRTKKMIGRKTVKKAELVALQQAYKDASKAFNIAGFESIQANRDARGEDPYTPKELSIIAQEAFAREFTKFADEQNNETYLTEYGKKARKFGEVSLGKRFKRAAAILGIGALGMATGGIYAAALFGTATAMRIWQTKAAGTVGHSTKKGTDRITNKINKNIVSQTKADLSVNATGDINELAETMSRGHQEISERTRRSNSIRRKLVPIIIASALAGGVIKSISEWDEKRDLMGNFKENIRDFDWNPFNNGQTGDGVADSSSNMPGAGDFTDKDGLVPYGPPYELITPPNPDTVVQVLPGQGVLAHLKVGFGLDNRQSMNAFNALKANGYFDGSHILGIGTKNGGVVNYLHGAGDDAYHFSPDAVKIIKDAAAK